MTSEPLRIKALWRLLLITVLQRSTSVKTPTHHCSIIIHTHIPLTFITFLSHAIFQSTELLHKLNTTINTFLFTRMKTVKRLQRKAKLRVRDHWVKSFAKTTALGLTLYSYSYTSKRILGQVSFTWKCIISSSSSSDLPKDMTEAPYSYCMGSLWGRSIEMLTHT